MTVMTKIRKGENDMYSKEFLESLGLDPAVFDPECEPDCEPEISKDTTVTVWGPDVLTF